jgi:hypothetical protein
MASLPDSEMDALRDALALVQVAHCRDDEGMHALLENADLPRVCAWLAMIAEDLLSDLAAHLGDNMPGMQARLRHGWLEDR